MGAGAPRGALNRYDENCVINNEFNVNISLYVNELLIINLRH